MIMSRTSKRTLWIALTMSAIATASVVAHFMNPQPASTEAIDTDHYVQDLHARGIW
jgi:hypothetical protein